MNNELYKQYKQYEALGLKDKAKMAVNEFIKSFQSEKEKEEWVNKNFDNLETNRHSRIRHEIFEEIIFPVLMKQYQERNLNGMLRLAQSIQNLYSCEALHQKTGYLTEGQICKDAFTLFPSSDEARRMYLKTKIKYFEYSIHEWPSGILWGNDGASLEEVKELEKSLKETSSLDKEGNHKSFLEDYEEKLKIYRDRVTKK